MTMTDWFAIGGLVLAGWLLVGGLVGSCLDPYRVPPRAALIFLLPLAGCLIIGELIKKGGRWLFAYRS